jgi:electron transport complex protein RnfB
MADSDADINRCPPGGEAGIRKLSALLDRPYRPLDPGCGVERPRAAALIDEARCIGCMLCIQACPVDAILGAAKRMHTVLTEVCTGCELCLPPCPVDCIEMVELRELSARGHRSAAALAEQSVEQMASIAGPRFRFRHSRLLRATEEREARLAEKAARRLVAPDGEPQGEARRRKQQVIQAALQRARERRASYAKRGK